MNNRPIGVVPGNSVTNVSAANFANSMDCVVCFSCRKKLWSSQWAYREGILAFAVSRSIRACLKQSQRCTPATPFWTRWTQPEPLHSGQPG